MFNNQGQHRRKQNLRKMDMEVKTVRGPQGPQEHRCTELEASEARVRGHGLPWRDEETGIITRGSEHKFKVHWETDFNKVLGVNEEFTVWKLEWLAASNNACGPKVALDHSRGCLSGRSSPTDVGPTGVTSGGCTLGQPDTGFRTKRLLVLSLSHDTIKMQAMGRKSRTISDTRTERFLIFSGRSIECSSFVCCT